jgi:thioredoxin reductase (NADPH)
MKQADKSSQPVILVVDDDHEDLESVKQQLESRYGRYYDVRCLGNPTDGKRAIENLRGSGRAIALILAAQGMQKMTGVDLLTEAKHWDPGIKRGLLITWGDWGDDAITKTIVEAMTFGTIDYYVLKPRLEPDELFHRTVTAFLHEWVRARPQEEPLLEIVGKPGSRRAYELRDLLSRFRFEHAFYSFDSPEGKAILDEAGNPSLPAVKTMTGTVLEDPTDAQVAAACGLKTRLGNERKFDVVIIGSGPAGLAAAVYGASEGLKTLVVERGAVGGQAGSSSMIRNYLGFARGISGSELAAQAYQQAWVFGTTFLMIQDVTSIARADEGFVVALSGGEEAFTEAIVLATGVSYRRLGVAPLEELVGAGVFYGAAASEAHALQGRRVFIVGGGNSAGQAALHLAKHAARVSILVRSDSLAESMSDYLIKEVDHAANLDVRLNTQIVDGGGAGRLQHLVVRDLDSGRDERVPADALFIMIGAKPFTDWLPDEIERDDWGYVLTGEDMGTSSGTLPFETSLPGVFAAGDIRHGSVKRVASAVGEGSAAIRSVHERLN